MSDWNPSLYLHFAAERSRPAVELLALRLFFHGSSLLTEGRASARPVPLLSGFCLEDGGSPCRLLRYFAPFRLCPVLRYFSFWPFEARGVRGIGAVQRLEYGGT